MDKHELLKSIGFSEEYIEHLRNVEESDKYVFENPIIEQASKSFDMTNVYIEKSKTSFSTKIESKESSAPASRSRKTQKNREKPGQRAIVSNIRG